MRLIDADTKITALLYNEEREETEYVEMTVADYLDSGTEEGCPPTVGGWMSVKDDMPEEHNSIFANYTHLSKHMWAKESDNVIVYVRFPDGTGRVTEGRLQDGKWWTRISPALEPTVTHWMPLPEPPEVKDD